MRTTTRVAILGLGRIGLGLAKVLSERGAPPVSLWTRTQATAEASARFLLRDSLPPGGGGSGWGAVTTNLREAVGAAELAVVAVPDPALPEMARALGAICPKGLILAHTSGCLPASALGNILGVSCGSLHPMAACPTVAAAVRHLPRSWYAIEGDERACVALDGLVRTLGGASFRIGAQEKPLHHAVSVLASNLVVALLDGAARAGPKTPKDALVQLARSAIENCQEASLIEALSGPLARGDADTVRAHLAVLPEEARGLYLALSSSALGLVLPSEARAELVRALTAANQKRGHSTFLEHSASCASLESKK